MPFIMVMEMVAAANLLSTSVSRAAPLSALSSFVSFKERHVFRRSRPQEGGDGAGKGERGPVGPVWREGNHNLFYELNSENSTYA
jgi:hypothetical protein